MEKATGKKPAPPGRGARTHDAERTVHRGMSREATAEDEAETMASTGNAEGAFREIVSGTATGLGIDRGESLGTGGLAAGEDLDEVAEGDYWRQNFQSRPYYEAGRSYEHYEPGYRLGWQAAAGLGREEVEFEDIESDLERLWNEVGEERGPSWDDIRSAALDAWRRARLRGRSVP